MSEPSQRNSPHSSHSGSSHSGSPDTGLPGATDNRHLIRQAVVLLSVFVCLLVWAWWVSRDSSDATTNTIDGPGSITVIGDSITARYDNLPDSPDQGWWSIVGHRYDSYVRTYAQSGSGYLRPGLACTGTRFNQRLHAFSLHHADLVIIEGGRNDWAQCVNGRFLLAPNSLIKKAVFNYLENVDSLVSPSTRVLVLGPPWGPLNVDEQERIASIIRSAADHFQMQFVPMDGVLSAARVRDGVHPNRKGSVAIAEAVITAIEADQQ